MRSSTDNPAACHVPLSRRASWAGGESIINALMARTLAQPNLISLAAGFVDPQMLPIETVGRAMTTVAADPQRFRAALQYGTTIGYPPLREAILDRLIAADGQQRPTAGVVDRLIVTAGSNEMLYLVSDALLDPGDVVLCSSPSYFVYLGMLANLGARAVGVATDDQGMIPEAVEAQLVRFQQAGELDRVKAIYVMTYFDNPCGRSMPAARRAALVDIAQRWSLRQRIYLIEDAAYRELRYEGDDVPSLWSFDADGRTVIHTGTFSKSFSPGLRIGWGILPDELVAPVLAAKGHIDFGSPNLNQHLMDEIVRSGEYDQHVAMLRRHYVEKRNVMIEAADQRLRPMTGVRWSRPAGGLYLWLELPDGLDAGLAGPLFDRAVAEGVFYIPGEPCYPAEGEPRRNNVLRLSFGIPSSEAIVQGVAALARAMAAAMASVNK